MAVIEVGELFTPTGIVENAKLVLPSFKKSLWFESGVFPGFVDAHAHPHVIDAGLNGGPWKNYVEWLSSRKLRIDEGALREDLNACTRLSKLTLMLSALQGTTLISLTGNFKANTRAVTELKKRPRVVATPTIIDKQGWEPFERILPILRYIETLDTNETFRLGIFCHSLRFTRRKHIVKSYKLAENNGLIFALHLSEGVKELQKLTKTLKLPGKTKIIGVHCTEREDYKSKGVHVVQCLSSNLALYGKTQRNLGLIECFGSDWPLIFGGILTEIKKALSVHGKRKLFEIIRKTTVNGYKLYNVNYSGDYVFFGAPLKKTIQYKIKPLYVLIRGEIVVAERMLNGFSYDDILKIIEEYKCFLLEKYKI